MKPDEADSKSFSEPCQDGTRGADGDKNAGKHSKGTLPPHLRLALPEFDSLGRL